jgi:hypothetical protein
VRLDRLTVRGFRNLADAILDVPPAWRKSLARQRVERDLFSGLSDEDDRLPETEEPALGDSGDEKSADDAG